MEQELKSIEIQEEKGASMLEYALLAALIAVVAIAGVTALGTQVSGTFSGLGTTLQTTG